MITQFDVVEPSVDQFLLVVRDSELKEVPPGLSMTGWMMDVAYIFKDTAMVRTYRSEEQNMLRGDFRILGLFIVYSLGV